jgi:hypothetical protein
LVLRDLSKCVGLAVPSNLVGSLHSELDSRCVS